MDDWRTAIDERTGRTYWYHRITRESTWTRPKCFDINDNINNNNNNNLTSISSLNNNNININKNNSHLNYDFNDNSNNNNDNTKKKNETGLDILLEMLEGLGGPDVLVELLNDPSPDLQTEAVQLFLSCCIPSTIIYLVKESGAIEGLISIIMQSSTSTTTRRNALRALCCLAINKQGLEYFITNQGWISLAVHFMKWSDNESSMLYIILICLLLNGRTKSLITKDILLLLKQFLLHNCSYQPDKYGNYNSTLQLSVFDSHPSSQGLSLFDGGVLVQFAGLINSISGELPGTVLVILAGHCFREEKYASIFISKGGISSLQILCTSSYISSSLREQGCDILASALDFSPLLRRRFVDLWSSLSCDLFVTPEVIGSDPIFLKGDKNSNQSLLRDVELRPRGNLNRSPSTWRVCSSILWSRCPGMRSVLTDFWKGLQQNENRLTYQGGLEISVDASEEVLALLVHYLHTGLLTPLSASLPPLLTHIISATDVIDPNETLSVSALLFELCRIASELQMTHLEIMTIQQFCEICHLYFLSLDPSSITDGNDVQTIRDTYLQSVLRMCEKFMLERLHVNVMFLLEYGYPLHIDEENMTNKIKKQSSESNEKINIKYDSPTGLRKAIDESVNDVTNLLKEEPNTNVNVNTNTNSKLKENKYSRQYYVEEQDDYNVYDSNNNILDSYHESNYDYDYNYNYEDNDKDNYDNSINSKTKITETGKMKGKVVGASNVQQKGLKSKTNGISSNQKSISNSNKSVNIHQTSKNSNSSNNNKTLKSSTSSSSSSTKKNIKPSTGGIYKLLLQESTAGNNGDIEYTMGMEVDTNMLDTSSQSNDESGWDYRPKQDNNYVDQDEDYSYDYTLKISSSGLENNTSKNHFERSVPKLQVDHKGKTLNIEEFISNQHSLAPPIKKKLTPSEQRLEEISKPKQKKTAIIKRGGPKKSIQQSTDSNPDSNDQEELNDDNTTEHTSIKNSNSGGVAEEYQASSSLANKKIQIKETKNNTKDIQNNNTNNKKVTEKNSSVVSKKSKAPQISIESNVEIEYEPKPSESPNKPDTSNPEVNETVRASLQLLKKKPRSRGVLGRGSSISESTDINNIEPQDSSEIDTSPIPPQQQQQQQPQPKLQLKSINSSKDKLIQNNQSNIDIVPPKVKPIQQLSRPKPISAPSNCTRNSDCTCALCAVPVEELPVVETSPSSYQLKPSDNSEPMIGSSKLTTLMKKRQEMNQQNIEKKKSTKSNIWRRQSNQLRQAIASARAAAAGKPLPQSTILDEKIDDGLVECPHCKRRFNETSAQRHIPHCKNTKSKPSTLKRGSGMGGGMAGAPVRR